MKTKTNNQALSKSLKLSLAGVLTALVFVTTYAVRIPSPGQGYFNPGDCLAYLTSLFVGPFYGFLSAALGSAFADLVGGYTIFVPGTFIIKGIESLVVYILFKSLLPQAFRSEKSILPLASANVSYAPLRLIPGLLVAAVWMPLAYLLYEIPLLGGWAAALPSLPGNFVQGFLNAAIAFVLFPLLRTIWKPFARKL